MEAADRSNAIGHLFDPTNVVLVGASDRAGHWSERVWGNLKRFGFTGKVFPVNPNRKEIWDAVCYPDVTVLPEPPDHLADLHASRDHRTLAARRRRCRRAQRHRLRRRLWRGRRSRRPQSSERNCARPSLHRPRRGRPELHGRRQRPRRISRPSPTRPCRRLRRARSRSWCRAAPWPRPSTAPSTTSG